MKESPLKGLSLFLFVLFLSDADRACWLPEWIWWYLYVPEAWGQIWASQLHGNERSKASWLERAALSPGATLTNVTVGNPGVVADVHNGLWGAGRVTGPMSCSRNSGVETQNWCGKGRPHNGDYIDRSKPTLSSIMPRWGIRLQVGGQPGSSQEPPVVPALASAHWQATRPSSLRPHLLEYCLSLRALS